MDIKQILEKAKENDIQYIEEVWYQYTAKEYHAICKFPNGRIYNVYNIEEKGSSLVSPFSSVEEAQETLKQHRPNVFKVWENPEHESAAGELELTYITHFTLLYPVKDFEKAYNYLTDDDMTQYALGDFRIPTSARDKIEKIEWILQNEQVGIIEVKTNNYLTDKESQAISEWISGQCSDGLGEGFEQQDFACYVDDEYGYLDDYEDGDYVMASFDWKKNNYELLLQE